MRVSGGETPPFRPPVPSDDTTNDPQLIQLMRDCWDEYPTLRPDFSAIRSRFLLVNKGKYDAVLIALKYRMFVIERKSSNNLDLPFCLKK